jgi:hypothetical protein
MPAWLFNKPYKMSLKEIELSNALIAELYRNVLVGDAIAGSLTPAEEPPVTRAGSANDAQLPGFSNSVVTPASSAAGPTPAGIAAESQPYRFLGKNQKKVTVLARYADDPYIPEEHLQFLIKILSACKLNLGDVAIINDNTAAVEISKLKQELTPAHVLLFDIQPDEIGLPLSFPMLKAQVFDGCTFLTIPPIAVLNGNDENARSLKKQLWDCLKKMFPFNA